MGHSSDKGYRYYQLTVDCTAVADWHFQIAENQEAAVHLRSIEYFARRVGSWAAEMIFCKLCISAIELFSRTHLHPNNPSAAARFLTFGSARIHRH
jgi:hypothetical protein